MKSKIKFDEEELEILQAWEAGALRPVSDMAAQAKAHRAAAQATFKKDQRLNIRISSRDLKNLQARALEDGGSSRTVAHGRLDIGFSHGLRSYSTLKTKRLPSTRAARSSCLRLGQWCGSSSR